MKKRYAIVIEVDETEGTFNDCEGCLELVFNGTPNTKDIKPITVLMTQELIPDKPLSAEVIRLLILERGLTVRGVIDAVSDVKDFAYRGLDRFDNSLKSLARFENGH